MESLLELPDATVNLGLVVVNRVHVLLSLDSLAVLVLNPPVDLLDLRVELLLLISVDPQLLEELGQLFLHWIASLLAVDHLGALLPALGLPLLELLIELLYPVIELCHLKVVLRVIWLLEKFLGHAWDDRVHCDVQVLPRVPPLGNLVLGETRIEFTLAQEGFVLVRGILSPLLLLLLPLFLRCQRLWRRLLLFLLLSVLRRRPGLCVGL